MSALPNSRAPSEPFVFGKGGKRMTPEDVELEKRIAQAQMAQGADFSPVAHWTQGLARASQGILGGLQARDTRRAGDANAAESSAVIEALLAGGDQSPDEANRSILAALANPYVNEQARGIAQMEYKRRNPAPPAPTEFERQLQASGVVPGSPEWTQAMKTSVSNKLDPWTNLVVGGNSVAGRQSQVQQALNGMTQGNVPKVTDQASYDAIPAGQQYTTPSGEIRVKGGGGSNVSGNFQ